MANDILITTYKGNTNGATFSSIAFTGSASGTCFLEPLNTAGTTGIRFQAGTTTLLLLSTAGTTLFSVNNVSGLARLEIGGNAAASGAVIFSDDNSITSVGTVANSSVIFKGPVGCSFLTVGNLGYINQLGTGRVVWSEGYNGGMTWASTMPLGLFGYGSAGLSLYAFHAGTTIASMSGKVGNNYLYDTSPSQSALFITKATGQTRGLNNFSQYNSTNPYPNSYNIPVGGAVDYNTTLGKSYRIWDVPPGTTFTPAGNGPWTRGGFCGGAWSGISQGIGAAGTPCFTTADTAGNGPTCTHPVGSIAFVMSRYIGFGNLKTTRTDGHMSVANSAAGRSFADGLPSRPSPSGSPFTSWSGNWTTDGGKTLASGTYPGETSSYRDDCRPASQMGGIATCGTAICPGYVAGNDVCVGAHHIQAPLQLGQIAVMWNGIDDDNVGANYAEIELAGFLVMQMLPPATTGLPRNLVVAATQGLQHMNIGGSLWRILTAPTCGAYRTMMLAIRVA
jgi:hypothetical protein